MSKRELTSIEKHFLGLPGNDSQVEDTESILDNQDRLDWLQFVDTLNDFAFSSDMLEKHKGIIRE